jgi:hypothetical protein
MVGPGVEPIGEEEKDEDDDEGYGVATKPGQDAFGPGHAGAPFVDRWIDRGSQHEALRRLEQV